jgi:hypothetical protein
MINGEFVNDLAGLLYDVTTSGKTQTFYDIDATIANMGLTICKNFKEVSVFWNFFQGSVRQTMIQNLADIGQDKEAWRKATDKIADLLHDNTMLTLENTSDTVKYTETYLNREITNPDNHAVVLKADASDSKEILALKTELVELKAAQATVTTTEVVIAHSTASVAATVVIVLLIRQLSPRTRRVEIVTRDVRAGWRARREENKY